MAEKTVSNISIRATIDATKEILGDNGLKALLNYAKLGYILDTIPDYSFAKNYEEREFSALTSSFYSILGTSGAKALFRLIGRTIGVKILESGAFDSLKDLPTDEKALKVLELYVMATGKGRAFREADVVIYDNPQCTACAGLKDNAPVCTALNGMFDEFFKWGGGYGKKDGGDQMYRDGGRILPIRVDLGSALPEAKNSRYT